MESNAIRAVFYDDGSVVCFRSDDSGQEHSEFLLPPEQDLALTRSRALPTVVLVIQYDLTDVQLH